MKKLITLTFVFTALLLGAIATQAQPHYSKYKKHKKVSEYKHYNDTNYYPIGYNNGYYNRRGVYIYYKNKRVWKYGRAFKNTYKIKVLRNGRKKAKLVNSVPIRKHYGKKVFYKKRIIKKGWKTYLVTYKITRYPYGKTRKRIIKRERIYNNY